MDPIISFKNSGFVRYSGTTTENKGGLEALFGALYLAGKTQRLNELFKAVMET